MNCTSLRTVELVLAWGLALAAAAACCADQVVTPDVTYTKVTVVDYVDGDLHVRLADGSARPVPLAEVTLLAVDSVSRVTDFNEAERYLSEDRLAEAGPRYERALRTATGFWSRIIEHRLLQVYDRTGQFERGVTFFLKVAQAAPPAAARLMPTSIPDAKSATTRRAVQQLTTASRRAESAEQRVLLELLAYSILLRTGSDIAAGRHTHIARSSIPPQIASSKVYAVKIIALEKARAAGDTAVVLEVAEEILPRCPRDVLPDVFLLKGRALIDSGGDRETLLRAGIALMRVAVHFPEHDLAPAALIGAAEVHEKLEHPRQAIRLLNECLEHPKTTETLRRQAEARLERARAGLAG